MLKETIGALVKACHHAVVSGCWLEVTGQRVVQVPEREFSFAACALLRGENAPVYDVHLGCDERLLRFLKDNSSPDQGFSLCADIFREHLAGQLRQIFPQARVAPAVVDEGDWHARGIRSFLLEMCTPEGSLFVVADLPSRLELATSRGSGFENSVINAHLRFDYLTVSELKDRQSIDSLLLVLGKLETDLEVTVTADGEVLGAFTGILLEQGTQDNQPIIRMTWDWPVCQDFPFTAGNGISLSFGLHGRLFCCETVITGFELCELDQSASIPCATMTLPERVYTRQRRQSFRLRPLQQMNVTLRSLSADGIAPAAARDGGTGDATGITQAAIGDISFEGFRLVAARGQLTEHFAPGESVHCRFDSLGAGRAHEIQGTIRRVRAVLGRHGKWIDELAVEFLAVGQSGQATLDAVRQFILAEQRSTLAKRVQLDATESIRG